MAGLKDGDDFKDGEHFKGAGLLKFVLGIVGFGGMALFLLLAFFLLFLCLCLRLFLPWCRHYHILQGNIRHTLQQL